MNNSKEIGFVEEQQTIQNTPVEDGLSAELWITIVASIIVPLILGVGGWYFVRKKK